MTDTFERGEQIAAVPLATDEVFAVLPAQTAPEDDRLTRLLTAGPGVITDADGRHLLDFVTAVSNHDDFAEARERIARGY